MVKIISACKESGVRELRFKELSLSLKSIETRQDKETQQEIIETTQEQINQSSKYQKEYEELVKAEREDFFAIENPAEYEQMQIKLGKERNEDQ